MGLFDIFQPGWKKDADKAVEAIEKNSSMIMVLKIHDECGFKGKALAKVNAATVRSLQRLGKKHPEAAEYLVYLAGEDKSSLMRCHAAWTMIDRPGMKEILRKNIAAAYADPGIEYQENPEVWISCVDDPAVIAKALQEAPASGDLRKKAIKQIKDQNTLASVVLQVKDEKLSMELMDSLRGNEEIYIKIAEQSRFPRCVKRAVGQISSHEFLLKMVMESKDEETALSAMNRFMGSGDEYRMILRTNRFYGCREKAVRRLGGVNEELIASVKAYSPSAAMELFEMANEEELIELADMGLTRAIVRLTEINPKKYFEMYQALMPEAEKRKVVSRLAEQEPEKYADSYYDLLTEDAKKKIAERLPYSELKKHPERYVSYLPDSMKRDVIDSGILGQDILEKLAMEGYVGNVNDSSYIPVRAYRKITKMERQERLLFEKDPKTFGGRNVIMDWRRQIIRDLSFNEEIMWRVVQYESFPYELRRQALKSVYDAEKLQQIAMEDTPLAMQAAEQLPKTKQSKLRNSKNGEVAKIGMSQYNRNKISKANEKSLLEIMAWEYANSSDPDAYLKALEHLESQDALCKALSNYLSSGKRTDRVWATVGPMILEKITDGPGLAAVCLESAGRVDRAEINRLRELIRGTDEEKKFTAAAAEKLTTDPPEDWRIPAGLLMKYYELPDAAQAAWRFGGPKFIQRLLNLLDAANESGKAKEIGSWLKFIYKQVPESHPMFAGRNGRKYVKHYDYYDSSCGSRSVDRMVDYVLKLED